MVRVERKYVDPLREESPFSEFDASKAARFLPGWRLEAEPNEGVGFEREIGNKTWRLFVAIGDGQVELFSGGKKVISISNLEEVAYDGRNGLIAFVSSKYAVYRVENNGMTHVFMTEHLSGRIDIPA